MQVHKVRLPALCGEDCAPLPTTLCFYFAWCLYFGYPWHYSHMINGPPTLAGASGWLIWCWSVSCISAGLGFEAVKLWECGAGILKSSMLYQETWLHGVRPDSDSYSAWFRGPPLDADIYGAFLTETNLAGMTHGLIPNWLSLRVRDNILSSCMRASVKSDFSKLFLLVD